METQEMARLKIPRHCVADGAHGLSPAQEYVLRSTDPIRIVSAPTGSGKSYTFSIAAKEGSHVLFIVPTRRLAADLARTMRRNIGEAQVHLWTSDERRRMKEHSPEARVDEIRARQAGGADTGGQGQIVIATPETVAWMLTRKSSWQPGPSTTDIAGLTSFDHIVFDEFHTITPGGLGLVAAFCRVVAGTDDPRVKVTFLSATPIRIEGVLAALQIEESKIGRKNEEVVSGTREITGTARAIHGDMEVAFEEQESMERLLEEHDGDVRKTIEGGRQLVVVYDSLAAAQRDKRAIVQRLEAMGISKDEVLYINSADDKTANPAGGAPRDGITQVGWDKAPTACKALVTTSSIEIGMNLEAGLMVTDPGHEAASLAQRIGRVGRGEHEGKVVIRVDQKALGRKPWLRELIDKLPRNREDMGIEDFLKTMLRAAATKVEEAAPGGDEDPPEVFRTMPQRAVWRAALFWNAMERSGGARAGLRRSLQCLAPKQAKWFAVRLRTVEESGEPGKDWTRKFIHEARNLRDIGPTVWTVDPDGVRKPVSREIFERHSLLASSPVCEDETGELAAYLDRPLHEVFEGSDTIPSVPKVWTTWPHRHGCIPVRRRGRVEEWLAKAEDMLSGLYREQEEGLKAAIELVKVSGTIPTETDEARTRRS